MMRKGCFDGLFESLLGLSSDMKPKTCACGEVEHMSIVNPNGEEVVKCQKCYDAMPSPVIPKTPVQPMFR